MHIIAAFLFIFAVWRWGDWRNWQKYHATMLYMITFSLLGDFLTYNYSLWIFSDFFLPTHSLNSIVVTFICFPATVLIYLSRFPFQATVLKKVLYISAWVFLYVAIEYFFIVIDLFHYDNGWHLGWSVLIDVVLFPMLLLHYRKPIVAYLLGIPFIIFLVMVFDLTIDVLK
jgi:hypothetical protein